VGDGVSPAILPNQVPKSNIEHIAHRLEFLYWGLFLNQAAVIFLLPPEINADLSTFYRLVNLCTYAWALLILYQVLSNYHVLFRRAVRRNGRFRLFPILIGIVLFGGVQLIFDNRGDTYYHRIAYEVVPMLAAGTALAAGGLDTFRQRYLRMCSFQAPIAGLVAVFVALHWPITGNRGGVGAAHWAALYLSTWIVFPLASLLILRPSQQVMVLLGAGGYYFLSIAYQSRGSSLILLVLLPAAILVSSGRAGWLRLPQARRSLGVAMALVITAGVLAGIRSVNPEALSESLRIGWEGTVNRWFRGDVQFAGAEESVWIEVEQSRGMEAREFIEQADWRTWLVGRGWGGGWKSQTMAGGEDWYIVHFGPLHLVQKGGLGLSVIFMFLLASAVRRSWRAMGYDHLAPGCFCFLTAYFAAFLKHGPLSHNYEGYTLWLVLGFALSLRTKTLVPR
jgi:hypothetical protein